MEDKDYTMEEITEIRAIQSLKEAYNLYGIEGTEEVIKNVLAPNPDLMEYMLKMHHKLLGK